MLVSLNDWLLNKIQFVKLNEKLFILLRIEII